LKMTLDLSVKEDLKTVALGTSKINYMDPPITVAWCKQHEIPVEKVTRHFVLSCLLFLLLRQEIWITGF
ncbi:hypothetical protein SELMODRAFT_120288, partial [Selaginella moellendorffii]